ncbi:MAG: TMEM175 family protein [Actinocatenispora sp.]
MAADGGTDRPESDPGRVSATDDPELEVEANAASRLTFFCDAVVAIAITLLALDLPVPGNTESSRQVVAEMSEHFDVYLAFLISFVVVAYNWRTHHWVFRYLGRVNGRLFHFSMLWLLMMISTPFATRVLTADGGFVFRFGLYAGVQAMSAVAFLLMTWEMDHRHLARPGTPADVISGSYRRSWGLALAFGVSIPVSLVAGGWAYACWPLAPLVINGLRTLGTRQRPDAGG